MNIKHYLLLVSLLLSSTTAICAENKQLIDAWRADIDALQQELETRHINLYNKTTKQEFTRQLTQIKAELPEWSATELRIQLMRVVKQIGDGHTQFAYWGGEHHCYPIELRMFDGELRLIGIEKKYQHLLGARLIAIDDLPIKQVVSLVTPILQGVENVYSEQQRLIETIIVAEILQGLKISKGLHEAKFTFKLADGTIKSVILQGLLPDQLAKQEIIILKPTNPESFSRHKISNKSIDFFISQDSRTAYLDFHHYPTFSEMKNFTDDLVALLREIKARNVIIDLRNNGGGDFFVGLHLAWAFIMVDNLNWRDGIYVLIGRKTFSASMSNSAQYRQLLNAKLVGEPTGANPIGYQDADTFKLPNSGWKVMYSKRFYRFQDNPSAGVQPDVLIPLDWNGYKAGEDNQLNWILNDIKQKP